MDKLHGFCSDWVPLRMAVVAFVQEIGRFRELHHEQAQVQMKGGPGLTFRHTDPSFLKIWSDIPAY